MGFAGFCFVGLALRKQRRDRLFHYITAAVVFVACIAYFTMGSNLGFTPIQVEFPRNNPVVRGTYREIFYVRYIDWFITTPLLLLDLLLTAGMPWPSILWTILIDEIMIVTGLVGALVVSRYKWAYFVIGENNPLAKVAPTIANQTQVALPFSTSSTSWFGKLAATPHATAQRSPSASCTVDP